MENNTEVLIPELSESELEPVIEGADQPHDPCHTPVGGTAAERDRHMSGSLARKAEEICGRFEAAWRDWQSDHTSPRPCIEHYLSESSEPERTLLLRKLLAVELEFRCRSGGTFRVEEYRVRFPNDESALRDVFAATIVRERPPIRAQKEDSVPEIWKPGDVILGLYEVEEVYTGGGRGLVYRVRHRAWNTHLAVKCPRPECYMNENDKRLFEREAETWVNLPFYRHTVSCYYVRRLAEIPRVFAEFVPGGSLADWIRTQRLYEGGTAESVRRILDTAIQIAWGLQHAHEQRLVHRDIKPGNVLLTRDGMAKVTDFGMARARARTAQCAREDALVSAGGMTRSYCSPEQWEGRPVSHKTDVWSWAVTVLHMFTKHATWTDGYLARHALEAYVHNHDSGSTVLAIPPAVTDLLTRCLQTDPDARPRDMNEVAASLLEAYGNETGCSYPCERPRSADARADGLNNRAVSFLDLKHHCKAEELLQEALTWKPYHQEATYNLGLLRLRAGRLTDSAFIQKLRNVSESDPSDWRPLYLLALAYLEQGAWADAIEALDQIVEPDAGREVVHFARRLANEGLVSSRSRTRSFLGHGQLVSAVCVSGDERRAFSASADRTLKSWDMASGDCLRTFEGHNEWVTSVSLDIDGLHALSGSADRTLRLWRLETGECVQTIRVSDTWVFAVALSPDGRYALVASGDRSLTLWDLQSAECLKTLKGHGGPVHSLVWHRDGQLALSASADHTVKLWKVMSGECLKTLQGHSDRVHAVAMSGDGRRALSGSSDRTIKLWDLTTGKSLRSLGQHTGAVFAVALSTAGSYALSASEDRTVKFWRLTDGRCLQTFHGHEKVVNAVCFGAGEKYALSGSSDTTLALWKLREVVAPYVVARVLSSEAVLAARVNYERFLGNARQAESEGNPITAAQWLRKARAQPNYERTPEIMKQWARLYVRLGRKALADCWESNSWEGHRDAVTALALSHDGRYLLSGSADATLRLWDVCSGECLRTFDLRTGAGKTLAMSKDSVLGFFGGHDHTLRALDLSNGRSMAVFQGHRDVITTVAISPDGQWVATGSMDQFVRLWELSSARCLRSLDVAAPVQAVCWSPDGQYVLVGAAHSILRNQTERIFTTGHLKLFDVSTGTCHEGFAWINDAVTAACMSFDGRFALVGISHSSLEPASGRFKQSSQLFLCETATGSYRNSFVGHESPATSLAVTGDGKFAVSASADGTLKIWETVSGQCVRTLSGHAGGVTAMAMSMDGRFIVSAGTDRTIKVWTLDWKLEDNQPADWHTGAFPYLVNFLTLHSPRPSGAPRDQPPTRRNIAGWLRRVSRDSKPAETLTQSRRQVWTERDFEQLMYTLGCAGYGWLRPSGVRSKLEQMVRRGCRSN